MQPGPRACGGAARLLQRPEVVECVECPVAQRAAPRVVLREDQGVEYRFGPARLACLRRTVALVGVEGADLGPVSDAGRRAFQHPFVRRRLARAARGSQHRAGEAVWGRGMAGDAECAAVARRRLPARPPVHPLVEIGGSGPRVPPTGATALRVDRRQAKDQGGQEQRNGQLHHVAHHLTSGYGAGILSAAPTWRLLTSTGQEHRRFPALLLGRLWPICSLVAPCQAGASPLSVLRGVSPRAPRRSARG